jgi:hypothetical protein
VPTGWVPRTLTFWCRVSSPLVDGRYWSAPKWRIYVGSLEQPARNRPDEENMVALMSRHLAELRGYRWHGLYAKATVFEGEDHATVFPRLVTQQGLVWALPKQD